MNYSRHRLLDEEGGVRVDVPSDLEYNLVFRQERTQPFHHESPTESFRLVSTLRDAVLLFGASRRLLGTPAALKSLAKLATRTRMFYCFVENRNIVHYGWVRISHCGAYWVDENDVVIGPIWTDPVYRGLGLAPKGLRLGMNLLMERGYQVFFIDTSSSNTASRRVIQKCEFGAPVAIYLTGKATALSPDRP